jgi:CO/xanthine dehydrogenase Mo-binding subunit
VAVEAGAAAPEMTAWIKIASDETVAIRVARQGDLTAFAMLIAEELECDPQSSPNS